MCYCDIIIFFVAWGGANGKSKCNFYFYFNFFLYYVYFLFLYTNFHNSLFFFTFFVQFGRSSVFQNHHCKLGIFWTVNRSIEPNGHCDNFFIAGFCRKHFEDIHPRLSKKHFFYPKVGVIILQLFIWFCFAFFCNFVYCFSFFLISIVTTAFDDGIQ